jgi:hypothetical protein
MEGFMGIKAVVTVKMTRENGWYIATSPDLAGLIVCHQNFTKFVQEIPACIKMLFEAYQNTEVEVEELASLDNQDMSTVVFEAVKKAA